MEVYSVEKRVKRLSDTTIVALLSLSLSLSQTWGLCKSFAQRIPGIPRGAGVA